MSAAPTPVEEVVDLLRQLQLPHMRRHAPDVLATAKAQRWEPAEALRALLAEEVAGRQASSIRTRRQAAGFPTGKTFDSWDPATSSIPEPTQRSLTTLEWVTRHENLVVCGPPAPASPTSPKRWVTPQSTKGHTCPGSASKLSERYSGATEPTTPQDEPSRN